MKRNVHLLWYVSENASEGGSYSTSELDYSKADPDTWHLLETKEVEFSDVEIDKRALLIDSLRAKRQKIIDDATAEGKKIEDKVQELLCLGSDQSIPAFERNNGFFDNEAEDVF